MKTKSKQAVQGCARAGNTMIEVIGVICIIVILASTLVPVVLNAIDDSRIASEVSSIKVLEAATAEYFRQHAKLAGPGGAPVTFTNHAYEYWDRNVLYNDGFIQRVFKSQLGTNAYIRLVSVYSGTTTNTTVLSAPGQVGHLPSHNANNGLYNLTTEYAALSKPNSLRTAYAALRDALFCGLLNLRARGVGPVLACYSMPPTSTPPSGPPGAGGGGGRHTDQTSVKSQIAYPATVAEIVIEGISVADAYRLSLMIDGPSQSNWAFWDSLGRVKYDMYGSGGGSYYGEVFIYLAHQ